MNRIIDTVLELSSAAQAFSIVTVLQERIRKSNRLGASTAAYGDLEPLGGNQERKQLVRNIDRDGFISALRLRTHDSAVSDLIGLTIQVF